MARRVQCSVFRELLSGCRVRGSGFWEQWSGSCYQGAGSREQGAGSCYQGAGSRVQGSVFSILFSGFRVEGMRIRIGVRCFGLMWHKLFKQGSVLGVYNGTSVNYKRTCCYCRICSCA